MKQQFFGVRYGPQDALEEPPTEQMIREFEEAKAKLDGQIPWESAMNKARQTLSGIQEESIILSALRDIRPSHTPYEEQLNAIIAAYRQYAFACSTYTAETPAQLRAWMHFDDIEKFFTSPFSTPSAAFFKMYPMFVGYWLVEPPALPLGGAHNED